jgi:type IV secretory pathway TraG/TraD family ATPase VirD4
MQKLWSAANVNVYGGNVSEKKSQFLDFLSELVGDYDRETTTVSKSKSTSSTSTHVTRERVFNVSDLASWPRGRALVFSAGNPAIIAKTVPWMDKPYAALIKESLAAYGPPAADTATADGQRVGKLLGRSTHSAAAKTELSQPNLTKG